MVTTDNEVQKPVSGTKAGGVNAEDSKAMKKEYTEGKSIAALATEYGYTETEVQAVVVTEDTASYETDASGTMHRVEDKKNK